MEAGVADTVPDWVTRMEIVYSFLARAAEVASDGTLSVLGGDFDRAWSAVYPCAVPVAVVVRFVEPPQDAQSPVFIELDILGPDGHTILESPLAKMLSRNPNAGKMRATRENEGIVVVNLGGVVIPAGGEYRVWVKLTKGGASVERVMRLRVEEPHD
jgi:hypothetical protein